jgi:hypothetical protein
MKVTKESNEQTGIRECRLVFLRAAAAHSEIRLGETLHSMVFASLKKSWSDRGLGDREFGWTDEGQIQSAAYDDEREQLLVAWATESRLPFDWVIEAGRDQIGAWFAFPDDHRNELHAFCVLPGYDPPDFYIPTWFSNEEEKVFRRRVLKQFRSDLDSHIRSLRLLRSDLLSDRGSQNTHYRWAAERVCLGRTWYQIAAANGVPISSQAISKAVTVILHQIDVPLKRNLQIGKK